MWPSLFHFAWRSWHTLARALPRGELTTAQKTSMIEHIRSLIALLPCDGCSLHAMLIYSQNPPNFTTGQSAFEYSVFFHNKVNESLSKRIYTILEAEQELNETTAKEYQSLLRDQQRQKIDHKKIRSLQEELNLFKNLPHATTNQSLMVYLIITIVVACTILLLLAIFFAVTSKQLHKLARKDFALSNNEQLA